MFCQKCGSKAGPGVKFCSKCGNSFADQQEAVPLEEVKVEQSMLMNPETEIAVPQTAASTIEMVKSEPVINGQKLIKNKLMLLLVAIAAIAIIIFIGIKLVSVSFSTDHTLLYTKENSLFVINKKMENPYMTTKRVVDAHIDDHGFYSTEEFYAYHMEDLVKKNKSGNRIFYMDNIDDDLTGALYYIEPGKLKGTAEEQDKQVRIASNVSLEYGASYIITDKGDQVFYIKDYDDRTGGKLYLHNLMEEVLIDKNVIWLYALFENNNLVMYVKTADDGETIDLYIKDIKTDKEKEKLESDVYTVVNHTPNFDKIYFTKVGPSEGEENNISLYVKEMGKEKEKLISDFAWIKVSDVDGTFMFARTNSTELSLYDLVVDDMLKEDEKISKPQRSDYESVVEDLKNETVYDMTTSLFVYTNGEEKQWVESIGIGMFYDAKSQIAIYNKRTDKPVKKRKLSTLYDYYEVMQDYWASYQLSKELYIMINGVEIELSNGELYAREFTLSKDGKKLYWIEGKEDRSSGALISLDVSGNKLGNRQEIDDNVYKYVLVGDSIWYYKDVKNSRGDLYTYSKGNKTEITYDVLVGGSMIYEEDNTVLFITDFNENRKLGTLNFSDGKDKVKIADDVYVYSFSYWDRNNIYYIANYKTKTSNGELWEYHGAKKKKQFDDSVNFVFPLKIGNWF